MVAPVVQVLEDSERNYTIHVIGNLADAAATLVDVSSLSANTRFGVPTELRLDRVQYDASATFVLAWNADDDVVFFVAPPGQDTKDYRDEGGVNNNAGTGKDGDVNFLLPAAATSFTATLWFTKKFD